MPLYSSQIKILEKHLFKRNNREAGLDQVNLESLPTKKNKTSKKEM